MTAFNKTTISRNAFTAAFIVAAALTGMTASAHGGPSSQGPDAGPSKSMHKMSHHKGHGKQRGQRHGMRSLLKGLDLTEAQRDQIFEIRHANMPALREQRKQMRASRQALRALSVQANPDAADIQANTDALGKATAAMAALRVQTMNQVMNVLTDEQATSLRENMQKRKARGEHRRG